MSNSFENGALTPYKAAARIAMKIAEDLFFTDITLLPSLLAICVTYELISSYFALFYAVICALR